MFQSLIGKLQTLVEVNGLRPGIQFQSLIGKLQTRP